MNSLPKKTYVMFMVVMAVVVFAGCMAVSPVSAEGPVVADPSAQEDSVAVPLVNATTAIVDAETESLLYMREEEKLAHDVYVTLYDQWGLRVFDNISKAESQHMSAVLVELEARGIADPAAGNALGVFTNPELQALYDELVELGSESVIAALKVGATIEDVDIADLQAALETATDAEVRQLFENLLRGSENHMRAFVQILSRYGETYEPQYIDADYYESIIGGETGNRGNGGQRGQEGRGQTGRRGGK